MKDIKKTLEEIKNMEDGSSRLGFAIDNAFNEDDNSYEDVGSSLLSVAEAHPDQLELIEKVVIAISGYSFETLKNRMEKEKDNYDSL